MEIKQERVYTEATPLLKEIHKLYSGKKSGDPYWASFFDNCDTDENNGCFYAKYETAQYPARYKHLNQQEFIEFMEFDEDLLIQAMAITEGNTPSPNEKQEEIEDFLNVNNVNSASHYTDVNNFKEITDSIASLLQYKNEKYGNSALDSIEIFGGKCKVGTRIDDKLSRIKNSSNLNKNDVADLIGYCVLICKELGWSNFDEFKD